MKTFAVLAASMATQAFACDLMCIAIYSVDPMTCSCVPIEWMECHPQYNFGQTNEICNQRKEDEMRGRNPDYNPYQNESWYKENQDQWGRPSSGGSSNWDDSMRAIEDMWGADESAYLVGTKASILAVAVANFI